MSQDSLLALLALRDRPSRRVIGLMSGTSADGVDAALVEITGHGPGCAVRLLAFETAPMPAPMRQRIWRLPDDRSIDLCELNFLLGEIFADAALAVLRSSGLRAAEVDLIGSHGQTARHQPPTRPGERGSTMQIGEGAVIAERTGLPVICDFRVADMAAGGQGAPLIPLVDYLLFREPGRHVALLNIGGIANVTVVSDALEDVVAFDTGPGNMALDAVARAASRGREGYDADGQRARRGQAQEELLAELLAHPFFALPPPRSTGREAFGRDFVYPLLDRCAGRFDDLMATLARLTVESVARALERFVLPRRPLDTLIVSGGGAHNPVLLELLAARLAPIPVQRLQDVGMDPDAKEALGFAMLANETLFCNPGNVPSATGAAGPRVLGKIVLPTPHG